MPPRWTADAAGLIAGYLLDAAIGDLLKSPPGALATIKRLPELIAGDAALTRHVTTALLTERLASEEAQEGLRAFLEKRPARWA